MKRNPIKSIAKGLRSGSLAYKAGGIRKSIVGERASLRTRNLGPSGYSSFQRKFKLTSKTAKPFASRLARIRKKVHSYGVRAR